MHGSGISCCRVSEGDADPPVVKDVINIYGVSVTVTGVLA